MRGHTKGWFNYVQPNGGPSQGHTHILFRLEANRRLSPLATNLAPDLAISMAQLSANRRRDSPIRGNATDKTAGQTLVACFLEPLVAGSLKSPEAMLASRTDTTLTQASWDAVLQHGRPDKRRAQLQRDVHAAKGSFLPALQEYRESDFIRRCEELPGLWDDE